MKRIAVLVVSSLITTHFCHAQRALKEGCRRLNNGSLEFYRLANDPDIKIRKNDKDTSVNRKDNRPKDFFYKRETALYRKDYTKLYKWL